VDKESNNPSYQLPGANQADEQVRLVTAIENAAEAIIITNTEDDNQNQVSGVRFQNGW
jgi:hypothetical protein